MLSNKPELRILAIETSCDETAAAVISYQLSDSSNQKNTGSEVRSPKAVDILSNVVSSQIDLHRQFGGVFPEMASRAHTEQIIPVIQAALETGKQASAISLQNKSEVRSPKSESFLKEIDLLAVTAGPGLIGSLLVGVNTAKTLAFVNNKPIMPINHWLGHIYSCFTSNQTTDYSNQKSEVRSPKAVNLPEFPLLALIVSGGHTGLVYMESHTKYTQIGETLDDAVGEAFDKVAKLLDLGYPGGPAIATAAAQVKSEKLKVKSDLNIKFPRAMMQSGDYNFSFSGLKTAVLNKVKEIERVIHSDSEVVNSDLSFDNKSPNHGLPNHYKSLISYEFQQACIDILIGKTLKAAQEYKPKSIVLCGGVSANKELRKEMDLAIKQFNSFNNSTINFFVPPLNLTGDNAVMIGLAASYQIANGIKPTDYSQICANSNLKLG